MSPHGFVPSSSGQKVLRSLRFRWCVLAGEMFDKETRLSSAFDGGIIALRSGAMLNTTALSCNAVEVVDASRSALDFGEGCRGHMGLRFPPSWEPALGFHSSVAAEAWTTEAMRDTRQFGSDMFVLDGASDHTATVLMVRSPGAHWKPSAEDIADEDRREDVENAVDGSTCPIVLMKSGCTVSCLSLCSDALKGSVGRPFRASNLFVRTNWTMSENILVVGRPVGQSRRSTRHCPEDWSFEELRLAGCLRRKSVPVPWDVFWSSLGPSSFDIVQMSIMALETS